LAIHNPEEIWREAAKEFLRDTPIEGLGPMFEKFYAGLSSDKGFEVSKDGKEWLTKCLIMRDHPEHLCDKLGLFPGSPITIPPQRWITANFWSLLTYRISFRRGQG